MTADLPTFTPRAFYAPRCAVCDQTCRFTETIRLPQPIKSPTTARNRHSVHADCFDQTDFTAADLARAAAAELAHAEREKRETREADERYVAFVAREAASDRFDPGTRHDSGMARYEVLSREDGRPIFGVVKPDGQPGRPCFDVAVHHFITKLEMAA